MSSPNWYNGKSINEVEFCTEFVQNYPLKCIGGKLYSIDGEISDSKICHDISVMLTEFVTTEISRKVKSMLEVLKLFGHSEPISVAENEIHLLNGILKTDGTWFTSLSNAAIRAISSCLVFIVNNIDLLLFLERTKRPLISTYKNKRNCNRILHNYIT